MAKQSQRESGAVIFNALLLMLALGLGGAALWLLLRKMKPTAISVEVKINGQPVPEVAKSPTIYNVEERAIGRTLPPLVVGMPPCPYGTHAETDYKGQGWCVPNDPKLQGNPDAVRILTEQQNALTAMGKMLA